MERISRKTDSKTLPLWGEGNTLCDWAERPREAARAWLEGRVHMLEPLSAQYRENSVDTYYYMVSAFAGYLSSLQCTVVEASEHEVRGFLRAAQLDPVSQRRYVQLLHKLYQALEPLGRSQPNPCHQLLLESEPLAVTPAAWLAPHELDALRQYLALASGWRGMRDRALFALTADAGLKAGELLSLRLADVDAAFSVAIAQQGPVIAHQSRILPGSSRGWWLQWVALRHQMHQSEGLAFPSTQAGRSWTRSGLYRRLDGWFSAVLSRPANQGAGAGLLRASFANQALGRYPASQVQQWLGHEELRATLRYAPDEARAAAALMPAKN